MPHNLYLHSSIVKYRKCGDEDNLGDIFDVKEEKEEKIPVKKDTMDRVLQFSYADSTLALCLALIVNASILIVSASALSGNGEVGDLHQAYDILTNTLGKGAGILFGIGLLCSGQSSTITGTLAGNTES